MTNEQFCKKINKMIGTTLKLVELRRDYFEVQTSSVWLKCGQSIYLSDDFIEWVDTFAWRNFKKHVKWDNINLRFWFEDEL